MDKKLKTILVIAGGATLIYLLTRKKKQPAEQMSAVRLPDTEILNSDTEQYFLKYDKSPHILEFKENLKTLGINPVKKQNDIAEMKPLQRPPQEIIDAKRFTNIADDDFMTFVSESINDPDTADGDKLSVDFVKDFNILIGNLVKPDFTYKPNIAKHEYTDAEVIKKGDKAKECNELNAILNKIIGKEILDKRGNYSNKLYFITNDVFKGTSVFNDENKDGRISKQFINNLYNLLNLNQKK